ncbi:ImmA/IrrE family metallo-endopeptidase [Nocardioides sp. LMS-CY]|uniref:ImmA/IrrE family metallo-endopeptidase n=1 Tax=Nocardioides sp. (strain LMS-CY) TaxID=2840457 RepID=UPI001C004C1A|nr:ImmA/IrrE family metallo-endopeptidase [Nocardioides sp. LMS-CY]QWF22362.1 ImmA/IrrE family metallo-endopeptidase [Nocardioides sp. LMS-CY]
MELLAERLGAELRSAADLIDISRLDRIDALQPGAFSACTFEIGDRRVIVWNPLSTAARTQSDIAHELSHLDLKHKVQEVKTVGDLTFFGCDPDEEQEANWQAGCFLLPRPLLVAELRAGNTVAGIAERYNVSLQMAQYRVRATGVQRQVHGR